MHQKSCRPTWTNVDPEGDLLAPEKDCLTALALAHAFNARRFLDIRHDLALLHMRKALEVGFSTAVAGGSTMGFSPRIYD